MKPKPEHNNLCGFTIEVRDKVYRPLLDYQARISRHLAQWLEADYGRRAVTTVPDADDRSSWSMQDTQTGCRLPRFNYRPRPQLRFNQLYIPNGAARWSELYVLLPAAQASELVLTLWGLSHFPPGLHLPQDTYDLVDEAVQYDAPMVPVVSGMVHDLPLAANITWRQLNQTIRSDGQGQYTNQSPMYLASYRPVTGLQDMSRDIWALKFVDHRYFWKHRAFGGMVAREQPPPAPPGSAFSPPDTWYDLLTLLSYYTDREFTFTYTDYHLYGIPHPEEWDRPYESLGVLVDAAAASLGCRFVSSFDHIYALHTEPTELHQQDYTTGQASSGTVVIAGGRALRGPRAQRLLIAFPRNHQGHVCCGPTRWYWALVSNNRAPNMWSQGDTPVVDAECITWDYSPGIRTGWGYPWTQDVIYSGVQAYFPDDTPDECPENIQFLTNYARSIASRHFLWQYGSLYDEIHMSKLAPMQPSGAVDYVLYDFGSVGDAEYSLYVPPQQVDAEGRLLRSAPPELKITYPLRCGTTVKPYDEDFGVRHSLCQDPDVPLVREAYFWLSATPSHDTSLQPGESATVKALSYGIGVPGGWEESTEWNFEVTLHDPLGQVFALEEEPIAAVWSEVRNRWETAGEQGLRRQVLTQGDVDPGGYGTVDVYEDGSDTGVNLVAYLDWMDSGRTLEANTEAVVWYNRHTGRWTFDGAACYPNT